MFLEKFIDKAIKSCFAAIVIVIPLVFWSDLALPHELPKAAIFKGLVLILWLFLSLKFLNDRKAACAKLPKFVLFSFIGYLVVAVLSTFLSDVAHVSFWGSYFRQNGLLQMIFYVLLFLATILYFSESNQLLKEKKIGFLLNSIGFGAILTALYSVAGGFSSFGLRLSGTLGQPNFLANYLLMALPFLILSFWREKKRYLSVFWGIGLVFVLTAMFLTLSRAMIFGMVITGIVSIFVFRKWKILIPVAVFVVLILILNLFGHLDFIRNNALFGRFLFEGWAFQSVQSRFVIWEGVWKMIKLRPFFGFGSEIIEYGFKQFQTANLFYYEAIGSFVDRAHNEILDVAANFGVVGLGFYLSFLFGTLKLAVAKVRQPLVLATFLSLVSLFAANMFSFSTTIHYVLWWLLMGILLVLSVKNVGHVFSESKILRRVFVFLMIFTTVFGIYFLTFRSIAADYYFAEGDYEKAYENNQNETFYPLYEVTEVFGQADMAEEDEKAELLIETEGLLDNFEGKFGQSFAETLFLRGKLYFLLNDYKKAIEYFELADKKIPSDRRLVWYWGASLRALKDYKLAMDKFEKYFELTPFWSWIDGINGRSEIDKSRFVTFFEQNGELLGKMQELVDVAKLAGNKEKAAFYLDVKQKIIDFLRERYKDV